MVGSGSELGINFYMNPDGSGFATLLSTLPTELNGTYFSPLATELLMIRRSEGAGRRRRRTDGGADQPSHRTMLLPGNVHTTVLNTVLLPHDLPHKKVKFFVKKKAILPDSRLYITVGHCFGAA